MYPHFMSSAKKITILFLGDIIGEPGRRIVRHYLANLAEKPDLIIANVENIAHGFGVQPKHVIELKDCGIKIFTGGNHTFDKREVFDFIEAEETLLRPANYPPNTPGRGYCIYQLNGVCLAVVNLMGRVFMEPLQSPYLVADEILQEIASQTKIILVDFHAEATAEKVAMGWYLDGRVSTVVGTHTHVQTADERILPGGTAYLTDAGSCGPRDGVIGMDRKSVFRRLIEQLPSRFEIAEGSAQLNGVLLEIDTQTGKAVSITRVQYFE